MKPYHRPVALVLAAATLAASGIHCRLQSEGRAAISPPVAEPAAARRPFNVLLVTLDTTRTDRLGAYGYEKAQTPALDSLAARGALFEQAYTSCPLTLPAHATMLTGLQPAEHGLGVNGKNRLADSVPTLAEVLARRGYRTGAFVAAFVLNRKFGLDRGFALYDDDLEGALEQELPEELSRYRPGDVVVGRALEWLGTSAAGPPLWKRGVRGDFETESLETIPLGPPSSKGEVQTSPFFAWVHLYDAHYPYHPHAELDGTPLAGAASYDGEVAFMDRQVGRLLAFLDERGLRESTLVIAVADHGEGLDDHGEFEHGHLLNQEVLHVPLLVSLPGVVKEGHRVPAVVSLRDLFPTVIDVLGIDDSNPAGGRSLTAALGGESIPSEPSYAETDFPFTMFGWSPQRSLTTQEWKYVRSARPELYDRRDDPPELYNLATVRTAQAEAMERQLAAVEARFRAPSSAPAVRLSEEDQARLAALGYGAAHGATTEPPAPVSTVATLTGMRGLDDIKDMLPVKQLDTELRRGTHFGTLDRERMLEMAEELVRRSPETAFFQSRLGAALMDVGKFPEAKAPLEEALRLNPDLADAQHNLGLVLAREGKIDDAMRHYEEALRIAPTFAAVHLSIGNVMADRSQLDAALGHYSEAARLEPDYADAHFNLANVLARRGRPGKAREHYEMVLRLVPSHAPARFNVANLLRERGDLEGAATHYREVLRLQPGDADARNSLAVSLVELGQLEEAEREYREAIRLGAEVARPRYNLGNLLAQQGRFADAAAIYEEAIRLQPKWSQPLERLAWLRLNAEAAADRDAGAAVRLAERAVEVSRRSDLQALQTLADAYAAAARFDEAADAAQAALRLARARGRQDVVVEELERRVAQPQNVEPRPAESTVEAAS